MKLLVVEDSAKLQTSLGTRLEALGYRVDRAGDGEQAIACAAGRSYDIIVLDMMLPSESSLLVLHEIREHDRKVGILILSARDRIHDRVTALIQGADDYLVKPVSGDDLHASIQSLLRRKFDPHDMVENSAPGCGPASHLNRLIENLLQHCNCEPGEIELVISEVKLAELLYRLCLDLASSIGQKKIELRLPQQKLPTLLVDARWMQHLLRKLLTDAIDNSPANTAIRIGFEHCGEFCALEFEHSMARQLSAGQLADSFADFNGRRDQNHGNTPSARFSLVESYADCMNFRLQVWMLDQNRIRIRLSNIKLR